MEETFRRKLLWLISIRAGTVTVLLGSAILVQLNAPDRLPVGPFFFLIGLTYALTVVYTLTLRFAERHRWLVDLQLASDALLVSALIFLTGGVGSYFSSLYALPIVGASILQYRRGGLLVGLLSALMYAAILAAQYSGWYDLLGPRWLDPTPVLPPVRVAWFTLGLNLFGFLGVALLSGYLAEGLRRADARLERASSQLADLQAFNQHIINSLTSGLATTDTHGRLLTLNRAAEAILGRPAREALGRRVADVLQLPAEFDGSLAHGLEAAPSRRLDYAYAGPDGRRLEMGLSAAPLLTPSGRAGFLYTFQDVTDIRRQDREARTQQRLAAVGEMAAGMAHEIRNPLASMSGSIQILRQELPLTQEQAQLMDIVLRESERLNDTIRSFLTYARPQRLAASRLDVRQVLSDAARLLRHGAEAGEHHVIEIHVPPGGVWYRADEGQIRQIVWNLATNSLRAMPSGGRLRLAAEVDAESAEAADPGIVLSVSDEGVGIPPEELDGIFQPFRGAFARGSGLGLAIVHRLVSDYGGEIQVASEPNRGTTVRVRLPAVAAELVGSRQ
jgi:two-component system, NtrC family, sensor histidine kinase PilS